MPAAVLIPALATAAGGAAAAGASIYGSKKNSQAARASAQYQANQANYAADLEAKSAADALAFAKQQEDQRHQEFVSTQAQNKAIYDADVARQQAMYDQRQANLAPYRTFGYGSLAQLARPIPRAGSIGSIAGS